MSEEANNTLEETVEEGDQEVVTIEEVLESQQQLMEDANAVLGAIDDKKCTYSEGYMKRQALYSCLTCIPEAKSDPQKSGGVCLACSYHCHEGHELIELYTKRNFRCDCGNSKFTSSPCNLDPAKAEVNDQNAYNQNFSGVYCTCRRPFPDPEDPIQDDMIQCIVCEDWYHSRHLTSHIPPNNSYTEMVCEACIRAHDFLLHYDGLSVAKVSPAKNAAPVEVEEPEIAAETVVPVDDSKVNDATPENELAVDSSVENNPSTENIKELEEAVDVPVKDDTEETLMNNTASETSQIETPCKKPKVKSEQICTKFWADVDWRSQLCTCPDCTSLYEEEKVSFLLDPQDPVTTYEEQGKAKVREFEERQHDSDMKIINSLNRVPLMECLAGYNDMKTNLMEYLKKFAENKKVVREEDIREFFSKYDAKKRQKCDIPYNCR